MNKRELVSRVKEQFNLSDSDALVVVNVFSKYNFFKEDKRLVIAKEIEEELKINFDRALEIVLVVYKIIKGEINFKLKHPFSFK